MTPFRSIRSELEVLRYRRALAVGLFLSVVLHGTLALAWRASPGPGVVGSRPAETAVRPSDRWEAEAVQAVDLADRAAETEIPPPPSPVAASSPEVSAPQVVESAGLSGGELTPHSAGEPGDRSDGDGSAGGGARRPPVPRSVLPEWDPPDEVRGTEVAVRVHVDASGRPTGAVELRPPTSSRDFNRRLREKVRAMEFSPARVDGRAVAGWAILTFVF